MQIVVIGAGVFGASVAWHLARAGARPIVIDQAHAGRATSAGAGIVNPWSAGIEDPDWYRLYAGSGRYYPELVRVLAEEGEAEIGYRRVGAIMVSDDRYTLDAVEAHVRARAAEAPEAGAVTRLAPEAARGLFPPLRADLGAVHIAGAARVDGRLLAAALLRAAERRGARLIEGLADLVAEGGAVRGVRVGTETFAADTVIITAGAWAPTLLAPFGITLPVEPQRGQITHLRLPGTETRDWPVVLPLSDHYLLAFDDQRVVVGATRETGSGFDYRVTAAGQAEVLNQALAVAPGLADATLVETRIGFRPLSRDGRPLLGPIAGLPGVLIGNGLGAGGLTMGPFAGSLLADLALGRTPALDLAPFNPLRLNAAGIG
jgi:D-amino-acid dehydrogenase